MAVVSTPSFTLRDFIQRILPMVIAVCLFAPFFPGFAAGINLEGLIVGAAILGYVAAEPLDRWLFSRLMGLLPVVGPTFKKYRRERQWVLRNWDSARLFFSLSNDDRESAILSFSYIDFYSYVGFLLLAYAFVNLGWLVAEVLGGGGPLWARAVYATTPMLGGWRVSTVLVFALALILAYSSLDQYLSIYYQFYLRRGQFDMLARLYHEKEGGVAVSIWGSVLRNGAAAPDVEVRLLSDNYRVLASTVTDEEGRFQFLDWCRKDPTARRKLLALTPEWRVERRARLKEKHVPCFDLESKEGEEQVAELESA